MSRNNTSEIVKMKILVFDDSELHRRAAVVQLVGHNVTIVDNFDAAARALVPECLGFDKDKGKTQYKQREWDVVLTDLLVPASSKHQGDAGQKYVGQEMPLGTSIVLIALANGVKKVGLLTDMNHHHHPASAAVDCLVYHDHLEDYKRGVNPVGDALLYVCQGTHYADAQTLELLGSGDEIDDKKYPYNSDYSARENAVKVKPWADAVECLLDPLKKPIPTTSFHSLVK